MARPKTFPTHNKGKMSKKPSEKRLTGEVRTKAGVELEEAGEKWRAGDAVKSMRFFNRAIEMYEHGLQSFPNSQDLAYNKARAQLETATHPILIPQLHSPLITVLEDTLASHRYVLRLAGDDADTLFNTAQVLTSLAEELSTNDRSSDSLGAEYLIEAWELLRRCYSVQLSRYSQPQDQATGTLKAEDQVEYCDEVSMDATESEQWASVIEPITKETLIDTVIVQMSTLAALYSLVGASPEVSTVSDLKWLEKGASELLQEILPALMEGNQVEEASVARATLISNILEVGWRRQSIDLDTYKLERDAAFSGLPLANSYAAAMVDVTSILAFNNALAEAVGGSTLNSTMASSRWSALGDAVSRLVVAARIPDLTSDDLRKTHLLRGHASLYQYQLSKPPSSYPPALKNSAALLKNAEVFYRNATRLTHDDDERDKSEIQGAAAMALQDSPQAGREKLDMMIARRGIKLVKKCEHDMVAEGLLDCDDLHRLRLDE